MTETTGALAKALAAFQAEMPVVAKGKKATVPTKAGGSYSYTYADLADVTAAAMPLLTKHGLTFISKPRQTERGYELVGTLLHTSGEREEGALPINGATPQEMGSSLTYMRRYLLGCMTGIVTDDDDDGHLAQQAANRRAEPVETPHQVAARGIAQAPDEATLDRVVAWMRAEGLDADEELNAQVKERREALAGAA